MKELRNDLEQVLQQKQILFKEPLARHTTFRVGGPAELLLTPSAKQLPEVMRILNKHRCPVTVIGNGSNLLVSDRGVQGVVVQLGKEMKEIRAEGESITAQAGALLSAVANRALEEGLTGFEFAAGIPGSLGGACVMNAGAYGGEMKDVIGEVTLLTPEGEVRAVPADQMEFGYRTSIAARTGAIVLGAGIQLQRGDKDEIRARMEELREKRVSKQPLEYPSAGSTFKRPEGYFAGKLIQDAGLRGFAVGGAQVSEKHCGFVVNKGGAAAADVAELMRRVSDKVEEQFGVRLEPEVKRLGEF